MAIQVPAPQGFYTRTDWNPEWSDENYKLMEKADGIYNTYLNDWSPSAQSTVMLSSDQQHRLAAKLEAIPPRSRHSKTQTAWWSGSCNSANSVKAVSFCQTGFLLVSDTFLGIFPLLFHLLKTHLPKKYIIKSRSSRKLSDELNLKLLISWHFH